MREGAEDGVGVVFEVVGKLGGGETRIINATAARLGSVQSTGEDSFLGKLNWTSNRSHHIEHTRGRRGNDSRRCRANLMERSRQHRNNSRVFCKICFSNALNKGKKTTYPERPTWWEEGKEWRML